MWLCCIRMLGGGWKFIDLLLLLLLGILRGALWKSNPADLFITSSLLCAPPFRPTANCQLCIPGCLTQLLSLVLFCTGVTVSAFLRKEVPMDGCPKFLPTLCFFNLGRRGLGWMLFILFSVLVLFQITNMFRPLVVLNSVTVNRNFWLRMGHSFFMAILMGFWDRSNERNFIFSGV